MDEAITCYNALTKTEDGKKYITKSMTLAEVYAIAAGNNFVFEAEEKTLGFKPQQGAIAVPSNRVTDEVPGTRRR